MSERRQRIPAEEIEGIEKWKLPFWTEPKHIVKAEVEEDTADDVLVEEEEIEVEPLTAEQLEAIRQEAYNEGLQQGLVEGRQKGEKLGYEEGHAEGHKVGVEEGRKMGFDAGHGEGKKIAEQELSTEKAALITNNTQILSEIERRFSSLQSEMQAQLPSLVQAMAEAVVQAELNNGSEHIRHLVATACDALPTQPDRITVRVNPLDIPFLEAAQEQGVFSGVLKADEKIEAGGCLVTTDYSAVDFTLSTRWQQVATQFTDLWQLGEQALTQSNEQDAYANSVESMTDDASLGQADSIGDSEVELKDQDITEGFPSQEEKAQLTDNIHEDIDNPSARFTDGIETPAADEAVHSNEENAESLENLDTADNHPASESENPASEVDSNMEDTNGSSADNDIDHGDGKDGGLTP